LGKKDKIKEQHKISPKDLLKLLNIFACFRCNPGFMHSL